MYDDIRDYFYKPIKIKHPDDDIFVWSDTHFGQICEKWPTPLWKKRGFNSLEEHDYTLIERWNNKTSNDSIFFHCGDIIFGHNAEDRLRSLFDRLIFKTLLLCSGNHTAGYRQLIQKSQKNVFQINDNKQVIFVPNYLEAFINGQPTVFCHYSLASWNGQGAGSIMLHGHSHSTLANSELGKILYKSRTLDVGVENYAYPISFKEIKQLLLNKPIKSNDHHSEQTANPF